MRQSPAASLFLFLIKDSPKDKHVQPADPGSIRHGGQFHRGDQQHAQNDTYGSGGLYRYLVFCERVKESVPANTGAESLQ